MSPTKSASLQSDTSAEAPKHTPGPWRVLDGAILSRKLNDYGNYLVASLDREETAQDKANLALIAAAPELMAALKKYANFVQESGRAEKFDREAFVNNMLHATDLARAAIAKAEGHA